MGLQSNTMVTPAATLAPLTRLRFETLRWVAGLYFLILGASLLLLPQGPLGLWLGTAWLRGICSAAGGLALLWLAATTPSQRTATLISIFVAVPQFLFAAEFFTLGVIPSAAVLLLFAIGVLLAPLSSPPHSTGGWQPDALGLILGLAEAIQGIDLLTRPSAGAIVPPGLGLSASVVGYLFVLGGGGVVLTQLLPHLPMAVRYAAHGLGGSAILGLWAAIATFVDPLYWVLGVATVLRGAATIILPWWSERATRFDGRSLRVRLALALVTVAIVPVLVTLPMLLNEVEQGAIERALVQPGSLPPATGTMVGLDLNRIRQVAFGIMVLGAFSAGAVGWWLAGRLAAPLITLMNVVGKIAAGERHRSIPHEGPTELASLSAAVETMAVTLDARSDELARVIKQLEAQNQELRDLHETREDNIRAISHDLRNPLTAIYGHAQLLQRRLAKSGLDKEEAGARSIVQLSERLNSMIQDLADSLRIEAGVVELKLENLDLGAFVQDVCQHMGATEQNRLQVRPPATPQRAAADRNRLERILHNLLSNALKYSPAETPVVIEMTGNDETVMVSITDYGPGLTAEEQAGLFKRYYRVKHSHASPGLGLGLYITRALVEAHGGAVWVESEVGKGSTFRFTVPRAVMTQPLSET